MRKYLIELENYYKSVCIPDEIIKEYLGYATRLNHKKLPVIYEEEHLAKLLGRSNVFLYSVSQSPESFYREFKLDKRSGGYRTISSPYPSLKESQLWILNNILYKLKTHSNCFGFVKNESIISNAKVHVGAKYILKLDLKDFFPNIQFERVIKFFSTLGYSSRVSYFLACLCCLDNGLPQGAPTSPALSNLIFFNTDKVLKKVCDKKKLQYSRYADDLAFSGDSISNSDMYHFINIIKNNGFKINEKKIKLYNEFGRRVVAGIRVGTEKISVRKDFKAKLRTEMHFIEQYGLESHLANRKIRDIHYLKSIIGKFNFWLNVEPDNKYVLSSLRHLKALKR